MNVSSTSTPTPPAEPSRRHPVYRGIRSRRGKWAADIREPGKKNSRIWLGTYPIPEMAAAAYDVASLAINWPNAVLNFPESASTYPIPASLSAADIQVAATAAAAAYREPAHAPDQGLGPEAVAAGEPGPDEYYVDEEELFGMPSLLADMAHGMLISPPRTIFADQHYAYESPENDEGGSLWSYES